MPVKRAMLEPLELRRRAAPAVDNVHASEEHSRRTGKRGAASDRSCSRQLSRSWLRGNPWAPLRNGHDLDAATVPKADPPRSE